MYLFELEHNPLLNRLIALSAQLQGEIKSGKYTKPWSVKKFLHYLDNHGVILSKESLIDMVKNKKPPMANLIKNIKDNKIYFVGQKEKPLEIENPKKEKDIVKNMAKSALHNKK